jgi:hypothetical protein
MKCFVSNHRNRGLTLPEALVIIAGLFILAVIVLPFLASGPVQHVYCLSNLKQVNLAFRIWEGDNNNEYPMGISVTNGGGKEFIASGDVADCLRAATNELSTTKILICPQDTQHVFATNFENGFNNSHISYFFNADVSNDDRPQMILDGDDNFAIGGAPVKSGILDLSSNMPVLWTQARHHFVGNIGLDDGSVAEFSSDGLRNVVKNSFEGTGLAANRIAIP